MTLTEAKVIGMTAFIDAFTLKAAVEAPTCLPHDEALVAVTVAAATGLLAILAAAKVLQPPAPYTEAEMST